MALRAVSSPSPSMPSASGPAMLFQEVPEPGSIESPLPGGVASVVRFFLDFPQGLQIAGVIVGGLLVAVGAVVAWRHRRAIRRWLTTRPRIVYAWVGGLAVLVLVGAASAGMWGWHYVQHDNGFCTGCHVMGPAFVRFTESEHSQLECHDCHQQSVFASMRQLYLWVSERPEEIGEHSPVATGVCAGCHITDDPNETWQRISATQGHDVHLRSDATELADVQCVTCHAREVHRFVPTEETCGQSGCHAPEETRIALGEMAGSETAFHCIGCHEFTAPLVGDQAPLVPAMQDCSGCHEMEPLLSELGSGSDPHDAVCGSCHNPHTQRDPQAASQTCATAGCHTDPQSLTPFHRGLDHGVVENCSTCHQAHVFVVDGDDCRGCHTNLSD